MFFNGLLDSLLSTVQRITFTSWRSCEIPTGSSSATPSLTPRAALFRFSPHSPVEGGRRSPMGPPSPVLLVPNPQLLNPYWLIDSPTLPTTRERSSSAPNVCKKGFLSPRSSVRPQVQRSPNSVVAVPANLSFLSTIRVVLCFHFLVVSNVVRFVEIMSPPFCFFQLWDESVKFRLAFNNNSILLSAPAQLVKNGLEVCGDMSKESITSVNRCLPCSSTVWIEFSYVNIEGLLQVCVITSHHSNGTAKKSVFFRSKSWRHF